MREAFRSARLQTRNLENFELQRKPSLVYLVTSVVHDFAHCTMTGAFGARLSTE
jgi:hypothetical protein